MSELSVEELFRAKRETLALEILTDGCSLKREISRSDISTPGLALAGFTERFAEGRLQVLGETEITYLRSLEAGRLESVLDTLFSFDIPALFVTKAQAVPGPMVELAGEQGIPVLRSALGTGEFFRKITPYLDQRFAPTTSVHGSLADVYGVGLLFMGKSGIGKSECVLDLVERGHRLVADDVVRLTRRGNDVLLGRGLEIQRHHMEIRGIGIIDVRALFGIRAIRQQKRVEVVVQLEEWSDRKHYDRTGLTGEEVEILDVTLPKVTVPLNPGKNITVISEVVAMNHLLKYAGVDSATAFDKRLQDVMRPVREYLEEDYE